MHRRKRAGLINLSRDAFLSKSERWACRVNKLLNSALHLAAKKVAMTSSSEKPQYHDVKLESFLSRNLPREDHERLFTTEACVAVAGREKREKPVHRHAIVGHRRLYLTEVPPKHLRIAVSLRDVEAIHRVSRTKLSAHPIYPIIITVHVNICACECVCLLHRNKLIILHTVGQASGLSKWEGKG